MTQKFTSFSAFSGKDHPSFFYQKVVSYLQKKEISSLPIMQKTLHFNVLFWEDHLPFSVKKEKLVSRGKEILFLSYNTGNINISVFFGK